jgi:hypothetical protein
MTVLLTPEQRSGIAEKIATTKDIIARAVVSDTEVEVLESMLPDLEALVRDREAIAGKIASIALGLESSYDACKAEIAAEELRALVTAIRGEKG